MRTLLVVFSAVALFFASCSNVESFRAPIEGLVSSWDSTTTVVTEFVSTLQGTQQSLQNQFAGLTVPEGLTLNEESTKQVAELTTSYQEQLGGLSELGQTVSTFVTDWQTKATALTELKDGLAAGKLGPETAETITSLQSSVEEAHTNLQEWNSELEEVKQNTTGITEQFKALIANLQGM